MDPQVTNINLILQDKAKITDTTDKWARFDAMTEEQRHEAAMSDPDALPMTEEDLDNVPPHAPCESPASRFGALSGRVLVTLRYPAGHVTGLGTRTLRAGSQSKEVLNRFE